MPTFHFRLYHTIRDYVRKKIKEYAHLDIFHFKAANVCRYIHMQPYIYIYQEGAITALGKSEYIYGCKYVCIVED